MEWTVSPTKWKILLIFLKSPTPEPSKSIVSMMGQACFSHWLPMVHLLRLYSLEWCYKYPNMPTQKKASYLEVKIICVRLWGLYSSCILNFSPVRPKRPLWGKASWHVPPADPQNSCFPLGIRILRRFLVSVCAPVSSCPLFLISHLKIKFFVCTTPRLLWSWSFPLIPHGLGLQSGQVLKRKSNRSLFLFI